jgi:hypothetical protein
MRPLNCLLGLSSKDVVPLEPKQRKRIDQIEVYGTGRREAESDNEQKVKQDNDAFKLLVLQPQPQRY